MAFLDANVFVHALLVTDRKLSPTDQHLKDKAKKIFLSLKHEKHSTSVVHLSEVANVLAALTNTKLAAEKIRELLLLRNLEIFEISKEDYLLAANYALEQGIAVNDALAFHKMLRENITEIYSFDRDFDKIEGIQRLE